MHRKKLTEKGIQNFKANFKYVLCRVDNYFPLYLWARIIPQTEIQANVLWNANNTQKVSAYAYLNVPHDFNCMPMAPLGYSVQVHKKNSCRA